MFGRISSSSIIAAGRICASAMKGISSPFVVQRASFSKYLSHSRTKRLPLSTKKVGGSYYKGKRSRKEGTITSTGKFRMNKEMCTELIVPDLSECKLRPYVGVGVLRNAI